MQNDENKVKTSFYQGMKSELKKVVWPTGRQTAKNTLVTIVFVLLISIILGVFNLAFNAISNVWYNKIILGRNDSNNANQVAVSGEVSGEQADTELLESGEEVSEELTESQAEAENSENVENSNIDQ